MTTGYTKAEALALLEQHIAWRKALLPYIGALERLAAWAGAFIAEDMAGRSGGIELANLKRAMEAANEERRIRDATFDELSGGGA